MSRARNQNMDVKTYRKIVDVIHGYNGLSKDCTQELVELFPCIRKPTLQSIVSLENQKRMKSNRHRLMSRVNEIYDCYAKAVARKEPPGVLLRLARKYDVVPTAIARATLGKRYGDAPADLNAVDIGRMFKDTTSIPDKTLAYETYLCILYDDQNGSISDTLKQSIGIEYELRLHKILKEKNVAFRDERHLRDNGYDKTPDAKLTVPIAVGGFVINWVESKALFGDREAHEGYVRDQYSSYWNRFGPGLVVYWFGYLETIIDPDEKRFIVLDDFPADIIRTDPKSIGDVDLLAI